MPPRRIIALLAALLTALSCRRDPPPARPPSPRPELRPEAPRAPATNTAAPWSDAWLDAEGRRYLDDGQHRRETLLASLRNHDNTYSRLRIDHYGFGERGWDALPAWNPRSAPVTTETARAVAAGRGIALPEGTSQLWDGRRPTTRQGWVELGRRVFMGYPMRSEAFMEWGLAQSGVLERNGVKPTREGEYPGLRVFRDIDGRERVGITCALCHTRVREGELTVGSARRDFDYGHLRLAFHRATGAPLDPELARRMDTWGPGRADVTEDEAEDPVAIPDLWGLRHQHSFTHAGTLRHVSPATLAIRQETQLLDSNHQRVRPPRELAWALAMFLYAIEPPPRDRSHDPESAVLSRGRGLFDEHCVRCHENPAGGGVPIDAARIGTDPALAIGRGRGTGLYRPAPLIRVAEAGPYLHQGAVATLDELFSPERLSAAYTRGRLGPGAIAGHRWGTELSRSERGDLVAWLGTW